MSSEYRQVSGNVNSFNVSTNYNNAFNFNTQIDPEGRQILQWLSPLEPQQRHQGVRTNRLDGIGNWVLETNEFRKWSGEEDGCVEPVLFCDGNPGVGKTYLSSLVIDSLCDQDGGEDIVVVGLYCDFLTQQEQSTTNMLGAILKQLASRGEIPEHIQQAFQKAKKEFGGRGLRLPDLVEIVKKAVAALPRVFICIDALDEATPKHRRELFESLREVIRVSANTRLFLTGRPHVGGEIMKCFGETVRISVSPTQDDIKSYLEMRLDSDTDPDIMDDKLRADIMRVIPEKISETFLLVSLNIDAILSELTLHRRRKKLGQMTKGDGLGDAYAVTLSRLQAQPRSRSRLGMQVLMWVSHSERPLHVGELCHALGVEEGSSNLNDQNIPRIETLLACTLGLVTVEKSSSTVRLIHYTLQEYLSRNPNLFLNPHSIIAEVCLTYLNFAQVRIISPAIRAIPQTLAFVEYASCHWGTHARLETTESVKMLALKLLDGYDRHISSKMLLLHGMGPRDRPFDREGSPKGFTGLHGVAYLGCAEIAVALLEMKKWDVQATDLHGNTALTWAARVGRKGVVKILLEQNNVNPNRADKYGRTPLSWAARNGHEEIVRMLLERNDVNPNRADKYGQTPLSWAAQNGHKGVVRVLLGQNDVNPNTANKDGEMPLSFAAQNGHEGVVRVLLKRKDVNPDTADGYGQTPLLLAAQDGQERIVRMLLKRNDVDPNKVDEFGQTPLFLAMCNKYEGIARILLERDDIDPNKTGEGRTLLWAAQDGQESIVKILLKRNDVDPNTTDEYGRTPLLRATQNNYEGIVRILLERNDVNPNTPSEYGQTPLSWAAQDGQESIVRILRKRNDVDPNKADEHGQTPLLRAARSNYEGIVRILLEWNDVNPNTADESGRTPLFWASMYGHEETVRILLERNNVDPNKADEYGRTPLLQAAVHGHEKVVRILLERGNVNPNTTNEYGQTPLFWAATHGHEETVRMLLELDNVDPNIACEYGYTPLSGAARYGHEEVVRILLERDDINPNMVDKHGQTPLSWATECGQGEIVRMLLERNNANPNTAGGDGQTSLSCAAQNGHEATANLLRGQTDFIPGYTPTLQLTELFSTEPSSPPEPPFKRTRMS